MKDVGFKDSSFSPLISVIVPVFRVEHYLSECLLSLLTQSYKNLEVIVVDDGSNDNCIDIALKFAEIDKRVFVVQKINGGQSTARNMGIELVKNSLLRNYIDSMSKDSSNLKPDFDYKGFHTRANATLTVENYTKPYPRKPKFSQSTLELFSKPLLSTLASKLNLDKGFASLYEDYPSLLVLDSENYDASLSEELKSKITIISSQHVVIEEERIGRRLISKLPPNQFVQFVDPDDYIHLDMLEHSARLLQRDTRTEFVWNSCRYEFYGGIKPSSGIYDYEDFYLHKFFKDNQHFNVDGREVLSVFLGINDFVSMLVLGPIRTDLLNKSNLRFSDGLEYEDQLFSMCMMMDARSVALSEYCCYVYRLRPNSTVTYSATSSELMTKIPHLSFLSALYKNYSDVRYYRYYYSMGLIAIASMLIQAKIKDSLEPLSNENKDYKDRLLDTKIFKSVYYYANIIMHQRYIKITKDKDPLGVLRLAKISHVYIGLDAVKEGLKKVKPKRSIVFNKVVFYTNYHYPHLYFKMRVAARIARDALMLKRIDGGIKDYILHYLPPLARFLVRVKRLIRPKPKLTTNNAHVFNPTEIDKSVLEIEQSHLLDLDTVLEHLKDSKPLKKHEDIKRVWKVRTNQPRTT
ncbi:glycosyltransferase family 2 protein [Helicobacter sp. 11S02629-2]|uniref:glycosyltransferase family 2 protein n=1 Tax=Helicobacter sp. 11S02629-2 TaxID=1476195 RepID=UPI000BC38185|nr:glycosyltransferase family 2 protein [Helicobacter sp. 11S02629-2]PAF44950.1 hypothetical protein BKH40_04490 [Helicobacter sp. 11S02629-2]